MISKQSKSLLTDIEITVLASFESFMGFWSHRTNLILISSSTEETLLYRRYESFGLSFHTAYSNLGAVPKPLNFSTSTLSKNWIKCFSMIVAFCSLYEMNRFFLQYEEMKILHYSQAVFSNILFPFSLYQKQFIFTSCKHQSLTKTVFKSLPTTIKKLLQINFSSFQYHLVSKLISLLKAKDCRRHTAVK